MPIPSPFRRRATLPVAMILTAAIAPAELPGQTAQKGLAEFDAVLVPARQIELSGPAGLQLLDVAPHGKKVRRGEVVARFDPEEARLQRELARGELAMQRAEIEQLRRDEDGAREQLELVNTRQKQLAKQGRIPQSQFDKALRTAQSQLDRIQRQSVIAKLRLQQAEIRLRLSELRLDRTLCKAPFDGVIIQSILHAGETLPGAPGESSSKKVLVLADLSELRLRVGLSPHLAHKVSTNTKVIVRSQVDPRTEYAGRVLHVAPAIDARSSRLWIEIAVPTEGSKLLAGMRAQAQLILD